MKVRVTRHFADEKAAGSDWARDGSARLQANSVVMLRVAPTSFIKSRRRLVESPYCRRFSLICEVPLFVAIRRASFHT